MSSNIIWKVLILKVILRFWFWRFLFLVQVFSWKLDSSFFNIHSRMLGISCRLIYYFWKFTCSLVAICIELILMKWRTILSFFITFFHKIRSIRIWLISKLLIQQRLPILSHYLLSSINTRILFLLHFL